MKTPHFPPPERVRLCLVRTERGIITTSLCQVKSRTKEEIEQIRLWAAAASHPPVCLFTADSLLVFSEDRLFCGKLSDGAEAAASSLGWWSESPLCRLASGHPRTSRGPAQPAGGWPLVGAHFAGE